MPTERTALTVEDKGARREPREIQGRYRVLRELGSGGMGSVCLVEDRHAGGRRVALKSVCAQKLDGKAVTCLKSEFLALASLCHPGLATVHDFGVDDATGNLFFTSEFVDGTNLLQASVLLYPSSPETLTPFLDIVVQILRALEFIHAHGLVHGDIKPENILVTGARLGERDPAGAPHLVKLIDFGLTAREKQFSGRRLIGTPSFIAPEAITGAHIDRRADLYSLGAVLYLLLTGKPPFPGRTNVAILRGHVEATPIPPVKVRPGVPPPVSDLILRLLAKKPAERPQSALAVIDEINRAFSTDFSFETPGTYASYLQSARNVGREEEMRTLREVFFNACRIDPGEEAEETGLATGGAGADTGEDAMLQEAKLPPSLRFILLRGERGSGKRRLLAHFKSFVQTWGGTFLWVECAPGGEDFAVLLRQLSAWSQDAAVTRAVERHQQAAARPAEPDLDEEKVREAKKLARRVLAASLERPLVIHAHNLPAAGAMLSAFLLALLEEGKVEDQDGRLLITATSQGELEPGANPLHRVLEQEAAQPAAIELLMDRLDREGVEQLLDSIFPGNEFGPDFARQVWLESDGNREASTEICDFFLKNGCITRTATGWSLAANTAGVAVPVRLRQELQERIDRLPRNALNLALAFACLGRSADRELAVQLARLSPQVGQESLDVLTRTGLLQKVRRRLQNAGKRSGAVYSFVHPSAQEILYGLLPEAERQRLHNLAGMLCFKYFEADDKEGAKKVAHEFLSAGNRNEGLRHGPRAAKIYTDEFQLRRALETYEQILRLCTPEDKSTLQEVQHAMAVLHFQMGNFEEAVRLLSSVLTVGAPAGSALAPFQVYLDMSRAYGRLGLFLMAESCLQNAMDQESGRGARRTASLKANLSREAMVLLHRAEIHYFQGNYIEGRKCCEQALQNRKHLENTKLLCRYHLLISEIFFMLEQKELAFLHCREALKLSDSRSSLDPADFSLYALAKYYKFRGKFGPALNLFHVCSLVRRKTEAVDARAEVLLEMGGIQLFLDRPRKALCYLQAGCKAYRKTKNAFGIVKSLNLLAEAHRLLGERMEAAKAVAEAKEREKKLGGARKSQWESLLVVARAALDDGDLRKAELHLEEAKDQLPEDPRSQLKVLEIRCNLEHQRGQLWRALELAAAGLYEARRIDNHVRKACFFTSQAVLFHRLGSFDDARQSLKALFKVTRQYRLPVSEGRGFLTEAMLSSAEGDAESARTSFARAGRIFQDEGSEPDLAHYYLGHALFLLQAEEYEQTFMELEEARYLIKKLQLTYLRPQVHLATGLFEAQIQEGDQGRALDHFRRAATFAAEAPFADILWQAQYHLGQYLRKSGDRGGARAAFAIAVRTRAEVLQGLPSSRQGKFLSVSPGADLESLAVEYGVRESAVAPAAAAVR